MLLRSPKNNDSDLRTSGQLWLWPVVLGLLTTSGLISALVSEDLGDVWSWIALGIPVAVMGWFALRPQRSR